MVLRLNSMILGLNSMISDIILIHCIWFNDIRYNITCVKIISLYLNNLLAIHTRWGSRANWLPNLVKRPIDTAPFSYCSWWSSRRHHHHPHEVDLWHRAVVPWTTEPRYALLFAPLNRWWTTLLQTDHITSEAEAEVTWIWSWDLFSWHVDFVPEHANVCQMQEVNWLFGVLWWAIRWHNWVRPL